MPELILEIGGRVFEVACEPGQEPSLERAARLLDTEAVRIGDAGRSTEKRMLLLAGLMLADTMTERPGTAAPDRGAARATPRSGRASPRRSRRCSRPMR